MFLYLSNWTHEPPHLLQAVCCKGCAHFCLFLLLGVNEKANETADICPMKDLTKGKLNIRLSEKKKKISILSIK